METSKRTLLVNKDYQLRYWFGKWWHLLIFFKWVTSLLRFLTLLLK